MKITHPVTIDAVSKKPAAQNADGKGKPEQKIHAAVAPFCPLQLREDKEDQEGKHVIKKNDRPLAARQFQVDANQGQIMFQSRSFFPVSSTNTSSRVGRWR